MRRDIPEGQILKRSPVHTKRLDYILQWTQKHWRTLSKGMRLHFRELTLGADGEENLTRDKEIGKRRSGLDQSQWQKRREVDRLQDV